MLGKGMERKQGINDTNTSSLANIWGVVVNGRDQMAESEGGGGRCGGYVCALDTSDIVVTLSDHS